MDCQVVLVLDHIRLALYKAQQAGLRLIFIEKFLAMVYKPYKTVWLQDCLMVVHGSAEVMTS